MGSFSEVVLGFYFRRDTPAHVLAAFSGLAADLAAAQAPGHPQPLPAPVAEDTDFWEPESWYADGADLDTYDPEPWRHDWAPWLRNAMGVGTCPSATLQWSELERWHLSCRASFKADAGTVHAFLRWLGPYISDGFDGEVADPEARPYFAGTIHYEYDDRPALLWAREGRLEIEHLATPEDYYAGQLVVVCGLPGSLRQTAFSDYEGWWIFDGFHRAAVHDDPHPLNSRFAGAALRMLGEGGTVVVSDVRFCDEASRRLLVDTFAARVPKLRVEIVSFAADVEACRRNLLARAAHDPPFDPSLALAQLDAFAPGYHPTGDVRPVVVWSPDA